MKTISKIELAMAASVMPFVAMSEPTDEDLILIETMLEMGDTPEEVCMSFDNIEGLRHVRIPATRVYDPAGEDCPIVMLPSVAKRVVGGSSIEGSCLREVKEN